MNLQDRIDARRTLIADTCATAGVPVPLAYGLRAPCRLCKARVGAKCKTRAGKIADVHAVRLQAVRRAERSRKSRLILLREDERFGLARGDVLVGYPYSLDSKWTIVKREHDGFEPECNQYSNDVAWLSWA